MHISRGAGTVALAFAAAWAGVVAPSVGARADGANAECANNNDVTVVVDFQELGGGVNVRCAPQPVGSGFDAFTRANIAVDIWRSFVCRIAGLPESSSCDNGQYPASTNYWVYWIAERGVDWCYSLQGAGARTPPPGAIEGWSFFKKTSARPKATPPRYPVPRPIPDSAPNHLDGGDCDTPAPAPTPTTVASSPPPATTAPPAVETPSRDGSPATTTRSERATTTIGSGAAAASTTTTQLFYDVTTRPSGGGRTIPFGHVDLSSNKSKNGGNVTGFVLSLLAIALVAATGFALRRRRA